MTDKSNNGFYYSIAIHIVLILC